MNTRHVNIPIFIPQRGCPQACVFCNQRRISGAQKQPTLQEVRQTIEEQLETISADDQVEIAYFGGSFTGIPKEDMVNYLRLAYSYMESGMVKGIRLSTRPDLIDPEVVAILKQYSVTVVELGIQSLDSAVLEMSRRGHTVEDSLRACRLIKESGISLGIQTMLGLPGDTFEKALDTAQKVIEIGPDMVRIYPALVLKDTEMEQMYEKGQYEPLNLSDAVSWCSELVPLYKKAGITVLRIGLQAAEGLEKSIIAGPYHPAFGELVESRILLKGLIDSIEKLSLKPGGSLIIRTRPGLTSKVVGQKRNNIEYLKKNYCFESVKVVEDTIDKDFTLEWETKEIKERP